MLQPEHIVRHFQDCATPIRICPYGNGHINDTYLGTYESRDGIVQRIHQRINRHVFKQPVQLMENIQRVTDHVRNWHASMGEVDLARKTLSLVPALNGHIYFKDEAGDYWRTYSLIQRATTYEVVETPDQAYEAGKITGQFHWILSGLPAPPLHQTIPDFHHTPKYFATLNRVIASDPAGRAGRAGAEIEFIRRRENAIGILAGLAADARLPVRIVHNDTKFNNVMIDDQTGRALCLVDLDTVMPGLVLHDFGDLVRTATCSGAEDEPDCSRISLRLPIYEALLEGYMEMAGDLLTDEEKRHLTLAGRVICIEQGIRFLTDYLNGDQYYKTNREDQNLDRCRTQLKMVASIEAQEEDMDRLLYRLIDA